MQHYKKELTYPNFLSDRSTGTRAMIREEFFGINALSSIYTIKKTIL